MKNLARSAVVAVAVALSIPLGATAAAADEYVHPDIAYALDAEPDGVLVDSHAAEWPKLNMRMDVASLSARSVGSCATGNVCAYSSSGQLGARLSWSSCGSKSTAALSTVGSIANARGSGTLSARQGTTVRASASAGSYANVSIAYRNSITNIIC